MAELEDGSVDLVMTSPPFLGLRSYLPIDHPDKVKGIGSEATPAEYLGTLLRLTAEWGRLLAPHGSICVELGDTYAGSGGGGDDYCDGWPLAKSLCGIPTLYAWSLAYGRNLLTGEPSPAGKWRVRNLVAWVRPNPPVGALGDKFRPATSFLTIACRARDRYFDLDAVRTPANEANKRPSVNKREGIPGRADQVVSPLGPDGQRIISHPAGAPPLDWWEIPPRGYRGAHYAVFPPELCVRPIEAMCPRRVCTTCGQPSRRIVERSERYAAARAAIGDFNQRGAGNGVSGSRSVLNKAAGGDITAAEHVTVGWSDCGHGTWRPGHVLDPFAGTGTTLAVAVGHGRAATGIDIDPRNADLARERLGMFLTVDDPSEVKS